MIEFEIFYKCSKLNCLKKQDRKPQVVPPPMLYGGRLLGYTHKIKNTIDKDFL